MPEYNLYSFASNKKLFDIDKRSGWICERIDASLGS